MSALLRMCRPTGAVAAVFRASLTAPPRPFGSIALGLGSVSNLPLQRPGFSTAAAAADASTLPSGPPAFPSLLKEGSSGNGASAVALTPKQIASEISLGITPDSATVLEPKAVFDLAWKSVIAKLGGVEHAIMPREIVWLSGAPGAGKGTMASFILKERDIGHLFEVSSLLSTPAMQAIKAAGGLIGDLQVVTAVLEAIFNPAYRAGVCVDGFPRTKLQAEFMRFLYEKATAIWQEAKTNPRLRATLRRPSFQIVVLYVDEAVSVERQIKRGRELAKSNQMVKDTGVGEAHELRATDLSEAAARKRYAIFREEVFSALQVIKDRFAFHFIDGSGDAAEVKARILSEFAYQSSLDLSPETYDIVRAIDPSRSVIANARSSLVARLNGYANEQRELLLHVIDLIKCDFMHIIRRQALAGSATIRSNNALLDDPVAVNMVLDVLCERGFITTLDIVKARVPAYVSTQLHANGMHEIICKTEKSHVFHIVFPKPEIRRNE